VIDDATGRLLITEALLELLSAAEGDGTEARFRWVRREYVQDADNLSKFVGHMDFGLRPDWLENMSTEFGPWDVDRFAGDHNTTAKRFNSLFNSLYAEAVGAMAKDWNEGMSFILPDFHMVDRILKKVERDNAEAVLTVPAWTYKPWWQRLRSSIWRARVVKSRILTGEHPDPVQRALLFRGFLHRTVSSAHPEGLAHQHQPPSALRTRKL
jgi:hypothetical protein